MMKQELMNLRMKIYKPSSLKLKLVDELIPLIKHCFGNQVETTNIGFVNNHFSLGKLFVKSIEINEEDISRVLIHWQPNYNISNQRDPFCSVYMLTSQEIKKLINKIKTISPIY